MAALINGPTTMSNRLVHTQPRYGRVSGQKRRKMLVRLTGGASGRRSVATSSRVTDRRGAGASGACVVWRAFIISTQGRRNQDRRPWW
ncbi:hypothetical protein GCM10009610_68880 [Pseudonocardia xinjiangensis]